MSFLKKYVLHILLGMVFTIMVLSLLLTKYNNRQIQDNLKLKSTAEDIKHTNSLILREVLHGVDLGLRGYAITGKESLLQPMKNAEKYNGEIFTELDSVLKVQGYNTKELKLVFEQVNKYIAFCEGMVVNVKNNEMPIFVEKLNEDKGYFAWKAWDDHTKNLHQFEDNLIASATASVKKAMERNVLLKMVLLGFSFPTFVFALAIVFWQNRNRKKLIVELDQTNRKYLFDSGRTSKNFSEREILESSKENMKQTADFVKKVAIGNYQNDWSGLDSSNEYLNEHTIAGELLQMQKLMAEVKRRDAKRIWANEGLDKLSEIIRNNQNNRTELARQSVSFLVKHMNGLQACLYIKQKDEESNSHYLKLAAQYAFDSKHPSREIVQIGEGLIGQAFKNKKHIHLLDIPSDFSRIVSGIGTSAPTNVLVVPFKFQDVVEAVYEISAFNTIGEDEIEFLEKAGEYFSAALTV